MKYDYFDEEFLLENKASNQKHKEEADSNQQNWGILILISILQVS